MKLLAFDTSTETMSVAVRAPGDGPLLACEAPGGAKASAELIPAIQRLLAQAGLRLHELDAIVFGRGPGSFTGLRTACAVAQGLGFGAGVPVLALDTLLAVAEDAHARTGATQVLAVLDARMGEVYAAGYERTAEGWQTVSAPALLSPRDVAVPPGWTVAGTGLDLLEADVTGGSPRVAALPTAAALLRLAPAVLAAGPAHPAAEALPLYLRDKVAQTTEERAAERARKDNLEGGSAAGKP
ncbi:MAG: tRNA (adenosine(37)-N6)-threonylcarbamoyltransferase complex dimerization subunit type 1 TsaB [Comamonadaceae bacterium]|nr:MAG: tRNA (adenosine(37)-N6)-threonylcarbamoyltransferase complex dimerization subunit type 1 TsaB [Comamonadaceae bacterium]